VGVSLSLPLPVITTLSITSPVKSTAICDLHHTYSGIPVIGAKAIPVMEMNCIDEFVRVCEEGYFLQMKLTSN